MFALTLCLAVVQPADVPSASFQHALVSSAGLDASLFDDAVRLRLPDVELRRRWDLDAESEQLGRFVFVHVSRRGGSMEVELITADGEAFVRTVPVDEEPERIAASFVVSLLTSIEREQVVADRRFVDAPTTALDEDVDQALLEAREDVEPEPDAEPDSEPEAEPEPEPKPEPDADPLPVALPSWQLDVVPAFGVLFGVLPVDFDSWLAAGGGELSVLGRSPRNVLVGGSVRAYGRTKNDHGLFRLRVAATVGHVWSFPKAEIAAGGTLGMTTWSLRRDRARVSTGQLGAQTTLVGAAGWVSGGPVFPVSRPRLKAIRVGGRAELGGAFVLGDGARAVAVFDAEGNDLFRIGGLELTAGLDVTFSVSLPTRS